MLGPDVTLNEYFYGVHVTHGTPDNKVDYEFQTDTISVNYWLDDTFWTQQHLFRVEWEPPSEDGTGGYIYWFIDGNLVAGIQGDELQRVSQTEIPSEPMYLLMNMAVSKDWSFPDAWYLGCEHKCWSCFDPNCACALPEGYCDTFPSHFEIDYVRVYQSKSRHTTGCSPPTRPTADFIEAHKDRYMVDGQSEPLIPVASGGAVCTLHQECGHGTCVNQNLGTTRGHHPGGAMVCHCQQGWTGPTCLAHAGSDDDKEATGMHYRSALALALVLLLCLSVLCVRYVLWNRHHYSERVLYDLLSDMESEKAAMQKVSGTPLDSSESFALEGEEATSVSYQNGRLQDAF